MRACMHGSCRQVVVYMPPEYKVGSSFILFGQGQDRIRACTNKILTPTPQRKGSVASVTREGQAYVREGIDGESEGTYVRELG
jgi:hypothetical protein